MEILIIEDLPSDARLAIDYIMDGWEDEKPSISVAESLAEALEALDQKDFDVLLTDLNLPDAVGNEVCIKIFEVAPQLPVIVLTGNDDESAASALVAEGAQDYLSKNDLNERMMRRSILYAIERKGLEEKLKERNRALAEAQEDLIYAAKMEATGHLAAGVAHEVKNPLAVIQLGLETLSNPEDEIPEAVRQKCFNRMQTALDRADEIIRELLNFSSIRSFQWEHADLNEAIENALSLVQPQLVRNKIEVNCNLSTQLPLFRMDKNKIEQSIINLLLNSDHALQSCLDREILITSDIIQTGKEKPPQARLTIEDTGPGVAAEDKKKVFDAFFTTKDPDQGTGLGLTVVQTIVQQHDGSISLGDSDMGGLKVEILFPVVTPFFDFSQSPET